MTDLELLALVLLATLVLESVVRLPHGSAAVEWRGPGRSLWRRAARWSEFARRGFLVAPLFPPLRPLLVVHAWPMATSPDGALDGSVETVPASERVLAWGKLEDLGTDGDHVALGGERLADAGSRLRAEWVADELAEAALDDANEREGWLSQRIQASLDTEAIGERLRRYDAARRPLTWLSYAIWTVFVALVALILQPRTGVVLDPLVAILVGLGLALALVLLHLVLVLLFHRAHRRLHPDASSVRLERTLLLGVSPLGGVQAASVLARDVLIEFHPVAVATVVCDADQARLVARDHLARLTTPPPYRIPASEGPGAAVDRAYRERLRTAIQSLVERELAPVDELLAPPAPDAEASVAYCPHCRTQYERTDGTCSDCELALQPLARESVS